MSAYTNKILDRKDAIETLLQYKVEELRQTLEYLPNNFLEAQLNDYANAYPNLFLLTTWSVRDEYEEVDDDDLN